jgi:hypothetical protein
MDEFVLVEVYCRNYKLNYMEKKIFYMIDVELSNRNPHSHFNASCTTEHYTYEYRDIGKSHKRVFENKEEFFQSLSDFQKALKYSNVGLCRTGS